MEQEPQPDAAQQRWIVKNVTHYNSFLLFPIQFYTNFNQRKSGEKFCTSPYETFACYKKVCILQKGRSRSRRSRIKMMRLRYAVYIGFNFFSLFGLICIGREPEPEPLRRNRFRNADNNKVYNVFSWFLETHMKV
jgi:hypothetical protein